MLPTALKSSELPTITSSCPQTSSLISDKMTEGPKNEFEIYGHWFKDGTESLENLMLDHTDYRDRYKRRVRTYSSVLSKIPKIHLPKLNDYLKTIKLEDGSCSNWES